MPPLISSKFPHVQNDELTRIAGFVKHAVSINPTKHLEELNESIITDPFRPHDEIHAYMPGLGPTSPFHDASQLELCTRLSDNIDIITEEYVALLSHMQSTNNDRFQSVTSMNYESG